MQMTDLGNILIAIGFIALLAGLIGLALARYGGQRVRQYSALGLGRAAVLASVAAPLMALGSFVSDARRMPDLVAIVLLMVSLVAVVVVFGSRLVARARGKGSTTWGIISGAAAALTILLFVWLVIVTGDLTSLLVVFAFAFVLFGAVAAVVGLVWLVVQLIRRRGRMAAATFVWSAVSLAVFGVVGIAILAPRPPSVPDAMSSPAELDQFLEALVGSGNPPSISMVVIKDGEMVYKKAFGLADGPNGIPATPDTVYHWFSATKIVTAIATMQLAEQGLVGLDDSVRDYLPFFEPDYPSTSSEAVTIANLLNHSSGLNDNIPEGFGWVHLDGEPAVDQTELVRNNLHRYDDLAFEPGSEAKYSNTAYYTLGALIEQVTGQSYEAYVVEHVLDPLGMVNTRFEYTEAMRANEGVGAHPMANFMTAFVPIVNPPWPFDYIREYDSGWIWMNRFLFDGNPPSGLIGPAPEMARFVAAILNGGEFEGARILSQDSVNTLLYERHVQEFSPGTSDYNHYDELVSGLGWKVVRDGGRLHHSHGGSGMAFKILMRLYPDEVLGIVLLSNATNVKVHHIADAVAQIEW
jgi:CubicO group peptidase (beta-lactamase class C family)